MKYSFRTNIEAHLTVSGMALFMLIGGILDIITIGFWSRLTCKKQFSTLLEQIDELRKPL